jgi:hypothetical protein
MQISAKRQDTAAHDMSGLKLASRRDKSKRRFSAQRMPNACTCGKATQPCTRHQKIRDRLKEESAYPRWTITARQGSLKIRSIIFHFSPDDASP